MSLYCFGKVVPLAAKSALANCVLNGSIARLHFGDLDPDDLSIICETQELRPVGVTFRFVSLHDISDATSLWLTASDLAARLSDDIESLTTTDYSDAIKATALGGFVWNLLNCPEVKYGALALVDGGIETIHRASSNDCWQHFLKIIPKPWDCHDNPLYIWSKPEF